MAGKLHSFRLVSREIGYDRRVRIRNADDDDDDSESEVEVSPTERGLSKCREPETETRVGSRGWNAVAATASDGGC